MLSAYRRPGINYSPWCDGMPPLFDEHHTIDDYVVVPDFGPQVVMRMPAVFWDGKVLPQKVFCFRHGWEVEVFAAPADE